MRVLRRLFLGLVAGLIATAVLEKMTASPQQAQPYVSDVPGEKPEREGQAGVAQDAARRVFERIPGVPAPERVSLPAGFSVRWFYGMAWGALYAILAPRLHLAHWYLGAAYGMAVWIVEDTLIPAVLARSPAPLRVPVSTQLRSVAGRLAFGVVLLVTFRGMDIQRRDPLDMARRRLAGVRLEHLKDYFKDWKDLPLPRRK